MSTVPRNICCGDSIKSIERTLICTLSKCLEILLMAFTNDCSLTQATDTSNIRLVFAAVKETILQNALKDSGIL
jgi:hypothetical protein